jgi:hypothetical protein
MERKGFIGGSDTVKIMRGEWLELWQVKTGRVEPSDLSDNIAVQLGVYTESFNLEWFEKNYKTTLNKHQSNFKKTVGIVPVSGTIDAFWSSKNAIIEAKHTHQMNTMDNVLEYYMPQIQTYAHIAQADGVFMSVLFGNNQWSAAYVERNETYFNSMWSVVSDFWGYVLSDREPVGIETPSLSIDKIKVDDMVRRDASKDNAFIAAAHDYIENEAAAKRFDTAKKDMKDMVKADEREVYCDLLTIKRSTNGSLRITTRRT